MKMNHTVMMRSSRCGMTRTEVLTVMAVMAVLISMMVPMLRRTSTQLNPGDTLVQCGENLRQIGIALRAYAQDHGGALPVSPTLENPHITLTQSLADGKYLRDPKRFYCPSLQTPALQYSEANFSAGVIGYFYYSASSASTNQALSNFVLTEIFWPRELNSSLDPQSWVMSDIWLRGLPTSHPDYRKGVNYLMLDGSVGFVSQSPSQTFR